MFRIWMLMLTSTGPPKQIQNDITKQMKSHHHFDTFPLWKDTFCSWLIMYLNNIGTVRVQFVTVCCYLFVCRVTCNATYLTTWSLWYRATAQGHLAICIHEKHHARLTNVNDAMLLERRQVISRPFSVSVALKVRSEEGEIKGEWLIPDAEGTFRCRRGHLPSGGVGGLICE